MSNNTLREFIDNAQEEGRYSFETNELYQKLNLSTPAIQSAVKRLLKKRRILSPRKGFYVIIPLEYRSTGITPAPWFIHQMMTFMKKDYYVGLLSAAALHGAAHQQPQEFHVVTNEQIRQIEIQELRIKFFTKSSLNMASGINKVKTETGYINVSNPEITAFDLIRYFQKVGGLNFVATVLAELSEKLKENELLKAAKMEKSSVYVQRLGCVLDFLGHERLTGKMNRWLLEKKAPMVPLFPGMPKENGILNPKWNVLVNKEIEVDEL